MNIGVLTFISADIKMYVDYITMPYEKQNHRGIEQGSSLKRKDNKIDSEISEGQIVSKYCPHNYDLYWGLEQSAL